MGGIGAAGRGGRGHGAWLVLSKGPAGGLLRPMVAPADRGDVTPAGAAASVVSDGMVEVTARGGTAAAREPTGRLSDPDEMLQRQRRPVGRGFPLVGAGPSLQVSDRHRRDPSEIIGRPEPRLYSATGIWPGTWAGAGTWPGTGAGPWPGTGTWPGTWTGPWTGPWTGTGTGTGTGTRSGAGTGARPRAGRPAWPWTILCAAVGNCPPGLVCHRDAPLGGRVAGEQVGDGTGVVCVDGPEPGNGARRLRPAEPGGQWHGEVHGAAQHGQSQARCAGASSPGTGGGVVRCARVTGSGRARASGAGASGAGASGAGGGGKEGFGGLAGEEVEVGAGTELVHGALSAGLFHG